MGTKPTGDSIAESRPDLALRRRFFSIPTLIGYAVAIAVLAFTASRVFNIDWSETWDLVKSTNPWWYLLALILYYLSFWFRGWRWNLIVKTAQLDQEPGVKWTYPGELYHAADDLVVEVQAALHDSWIVLPEQCRALCEGGSTGSSHPRIHIEQPGEHTRMLVFSRSPPGCP